MMRRHVLFSWLVLSACSYDFGGSDTTNGAGGSATSGSGATSGDANGSASPASGSVTTTSAGLVASASSATSSSTGTIPLPDVIPTCGSFTDDFAGNAVDTTRWEVSESSADVRQNGEVQLETYDGSTALAQLALKGPLQAPCAFVFDLPWGRSIIAFRAQQGDQALGLASDSYDDRYYIHRDGMNEALPQETDDPEGVAVVLLDDRIVVLAQEDQDPWQIVVEEPRNAGDDWVTSAQAAAFVAGDYDIGAVDNYGARVVHASDLGQ